MKKIILSIALVLVGMFGAANAQTHQTQNEGVVGYTHLFQDVNFRPLNEAFSTDWHNSSGAFVGYTRYTVPAKGQQAGIFGLTAEAGINFNSDRVTMATVMGGGVVKARNSQYIQPYARGLVGVAQQNIKAVNIFDKSQTSVAFDLGTGIDWRLAKDSRYSLRTGVDYLNTGFNGERQNNVRLVAGLVF